MRVACELLLDILINQQVSFRKRQNSCARSDYVINCKIIRPLPYKGEFALSVLFRPTLSYLEDILKNDIVYGSV